jgi:thioredoxin-dependent peroxiredoxin
MSNRTIEFKGQPMTLLGRTLSVGDAFPAVTLHATDFSAVNTGSMTGKPTLISVVPSLDTGVCDAQTKRFNEEAAKLGDDVRVVTVSADPPFTQRRWVNDAEVKNITVLSDHMDMAFGDAAGVHIKELRLDQRSVFVLDGAGVVQHVEYVPVFGQHPDYDAAIDAVKKLLG